MSHELWLREVSRQLHMEDGWTGEANTVEQAADAFAELQAEIATLQRELAGATRRIKELQTEVSQCDGVFIDATDTIQQLRRELAEAKQRADENAERTLVIMAERDALKSWKESAARLLQRSNEAMRGYFNDEFNIDRRFSELTADIPQFLASQSAPLSSAIDDAISGTRVDVAPQPLTGEQS